MAEREVVLDKPVVIDEQSEALRKATERAEMAEAQLAKMKGGASNQAGNDAGQKSSAAAGAEPTKSPASPSSAGEEQKLQGGEEELRNDSMMAHLLDSLGQGKDIGHYGRLVFAMVARHFMSHDEVLTWLTKDQDFGDEQARLMLRQVEGRDYSPPKRARIVEWQAQQEFPILPNPDDPDCGNLYRNLKFPEEIYSHIGQYQEKKMEADE